MKTNKVECTTLECTACNRGSEAGSREAVINMAKLHARTEGHPMPTNFRFIALEIFILVISHAKAEEEGT